MVSYLEQVMNERDQIAKKYDLDGIKTKERRHPTIAVVGFPCLMQTLI